VPIPFFVTLDGTLEGRRGFRFRTGVRFPPPPLSKPSKTHEVETRTWEGSKKVPKWDRSTRWRCLDGRPTKRSFGSRRRGPLQTVALRISESSWWSTPIHPVSVGGLPWACSLKRVGSKMRAASARIATGDLEHPIAVVQESVCGSFAGVSERSLAASGRSFPAPQSVHHAWFLQRASTLARMRCRRA